jgi:ABC-type sugar transport system permease subunit
MFTPILESLRMVFSKVDIVANHGFSMTFTGLENLRGVLLVDPWFNRGLINEIGRMLLLVPAIVFYSLFVALILNQAFRARSLVRLVLFLPVIISSGIMIGLEANNGLLDSMSELIKETNQMKTSVTKVLEDILLAEGTTNRFMAYFFTIINQIYNIAMASGIQIIIFLSALQTIPNSVYEAARIEGSTDWECFWKITFPMISSMILVNIVYSVVDFLLRTDNAAMIRLTDQLNAFQYSTSVTMAWLYFLAVIAVIGISLGIISRKVYYYE